MLHRLYLPNPYRHALRDEIITLSKESPCAPSHNVGGWRSDDRFLERFEPATSWFADALRGAMKHLTGSTDLLAWAVVNPPGAYHGRHHHRLHYKWSGVYYVDPGGENSGRTIIELDGGEISIVPEHDLLIAFPVDTWHSVTPHGGDRPRITIAFDAR